MDIKKTIRQFTNELLKVKGWKQKAFDRMKKQETRGDREGAELSRQAYEYCKAYEKRLNHILDSYKNAGGKKYFTKDAGHRYRYKNGQPIE